MFHALLERLKSLLRPDPDLPPVQNAGGRAHIPGLSLERARERFRAALQAWKAGELPTPAVHEEVQLLGTSISRRCFREADFKTQEAFDFFNLAAEVAGATSYEPATRWVADVALRLEAEALGSLYFHRDWSRIVARRGPIESFGMVRCGRCSLEFPRVGTSGFLMMCFQWCRECGKILGETVSCVEAERTLEPYSEQTAEQQADTARRLGVPWRRCKCGGTIHNLYSCPGCGSREFHHEALPMSAFQYFETHCYEELKGQPQQALE